MKLVNIDEENFHLLNDLRNFNEFFRKNVIYDNIKSHKKNRASPSLQKIQLWKNHREVGQIEPPLPLNLFSVNLRVLCYNKWNTNTCQFTRSLTKFSLSKSFICFEYPFSKNLVDLNYVTSFICQLIHIHIRLLVT